MTFDHPVAGPADDEVPVEPDAAVPWWGKAALAAFVILVVCGYIGSAVAPNWALNHPEGLIALHARIRHLLLALGNGIDWLPYAIIGGLRLGVAYAVCHLIGRAYGDRVLYYFGRYLGVTNEAIDSIEAAFDKLDWLIVPWFTGSNIVAAFTGIRQMPVPRLVVLVTIGIAGRLLLFWWIADLFSGQLDTVLDWLDRYQRPFLIGSIALVVVTVALNMRRGRSFQR